MFASLGLAVFFATWGLNFDLTLFLKDLLVLLTIRLSY